MSWLEGELELSDNSAWEYNGNTGNDNSDDINDNSDEDVNDDDGTNDTESEIKIVMTIMVVVITKKKPMSTIMLLQIYLWEALYTVFTSSTGAIMLREEAEAVVSCSPK